MDIALPGGSGLEAMRHMLARQSGLRVLVFSMHGEAIFVTRALQQGACGYITKASAPEVLVHAVHAVAQGDTYLSSDVASFAAAFAVPPLLSGVESLTTREFEVFRMLAHGSSVKQIGEQLGLSEKTVANQQSVIREKLGVHNGAQLARLAGERGLVP
jgi:DNA-binding NarL/FixJ family response regulator